MALEYARDPELEAERDHALAECTRLAGLLAMDDIVLDSWRDTAIHYHDLATEAKDDRDEALAECTRLHEKFEAAANSRDFWKMSADGHEELEALYKSEWASTMQERNLARAWARYYRRRCERLEAENESFKHRAEIPMTKQECRECLRWEFWDKATTRIAEQDEAYVKLRAENESLKRAAMRHEQGTLIEDNYWAGIALQQVDVIRTARRFARAWKRAARKYKCLHNLSEGDMLAWKSTADLYIEEAVRLGALLADAIALIKHLWPLREYYRRNEEMRQREQID